MYTCIIHVHLWVLVRTWVSDPNMGLNYLVSHTSILSTRVMPISSTPTNSGDYANLWVMHTYIREIGRWGFCISSVPYRNQSCSNPVTMHNMYEYYLLGILTLWSSFTELDISSTLWWEWSFPLMNGVLNLVLFKGGRPPAFWEGAAQRRIFTN